MRLDARPPRKADVSSGWGRLVRCMIHEALPPHVPEMEAALPLGARGVRLHAVASVTCLLGCPFSSRRARKEGGRPCKDPMCPLPLPSAMMGSSGWGRPPRPSKHRLVSSRPRRRTARHRQERDARRTGGGGLGGGPKSASEGIADTEQPRRLPSERPTHEAEHPTHGALTEAPCLMPHALWLQHFL